MENIGLFYSFNTKNTSAAAQMILKEWKDKNNTIEAVNVEEAMEEDFDRFNHFILGVPTWWDGELPNYWDEFLPSVEDNSLQGKTFAIYGAGDQKAYPDNFVDAIGIMADFITKRGGEVIGFTENIGYEFDHSKALKEDKFVGLALDFENQKNKVPEQIKNWIKKLRIDFPE
ncbi:MAG: flavodoxin [Bacteroidetes bacterium 4572_77]|nr:MAG: flavodoxin [Bacteroidetes bacterium 4572_77]